MVVKYSLFNNLAGGFKYFFLIFIPTGGKWSILTNIFQMGWNHQPVLPYFRELGVAINLRAVDLAIASLASRWTALMEEFHPTAHNVYIYIYIYISPEGKYQLSPEKDSLPKKEIFIFEPSIFWSYDSFQAGFFRWVIHYLSPLNFCTRSSNFWAESRESKLIYLGVEAPVIYI